ncbi:MAG: sigma-70 family RNA polymerase sigma factor [Pseudomonadota bacterium]
MSKIAARNAEAEQEFARRYLAPLTKILSKRCKSREQAEDAAQTALITVLQRLRGGKIDDPSKLTAFVHKTGINVLIGDQRKISRRETGTDTELVERTVDERIDQLEDIIREESDLAVREVVQEIKNDRDRELIYRFYIRQEEKFVICSALELTAVHFDRVISRARGRLRSLIETKRPELIGLF